MLGKKTRGTKRSLKSDCIITAIKSRIVFLIET
jgi:hypothetical protein